MEKATRLQFDDMIKDEDLLRGIYAYGFQKPTQVQRKILSLTLSKQDVICQAPSNAGKTSACIMGMLQMIDTSCSEVQAIVLVPTREWAANIECMVRHLSQYSLIKSYCLIGGTSIRESANKIRQGSTHVIVGTPGRINDFINREILNTKSLRLMMIDQADQLLSRGFGDLIREINRSFNHRVHWVSNSSTRSSEMLVLEQELLHEPVSVKIESPQFTLDGIKQFHFRIQKDTDKMQALCGLIKQESDVQCIIYANKSATVEAIEQKMKEQWHISSLSCTKNMTSQERSKCMKQFRSGSARTMITTETSERGFDVSHVGIIVNYDVPADEWVYLGRAGRRGRFGRKGIVVSLAENQRDMEQIKKLQLALTVSINPLSMPQQE